MWGFTVSPNRELFFKNKDDITEFIVKSLDTETQNLYWMKFPKNITSQDAKQKQDKRNLNKSLSFVSQTIKQAIW
jgi:hypothetical protein